MTNLALITGASSGIGLELAREHARAGGDVVLVARRKEELDVLAKDLERAYGVKAHVKALDLSTPGAAKELVAWVKRKKLQVDFLVNNAGYGGTGTFGERALEMELNMMQLNTGTLVALTHYYLAEMRERGGGRILNVGSTAGFLPGPSQAVYYATKAFVNSFSLALAQENRKTGVSVTVLCPGPVETGFAARADAEGTKLFENAISVEKVAALGYKAMMKGKDIVVVPRSYASLRWSGLLPRRALLATAKRLNES